MMGQKGASLETTRRIHRKMAKDLEENRAIVEQKRRRPGYDEAHCLRAEIVRSLEHQLSGESPPVGVLKGVWKQVCEEAKRKATTDMGAGVGARDAHGKGGSR